MISAGHHESLDDPPQIPALTGVTPKRKQKESLAEAITGAASTLLGAFHSKGSADVSLARSPAIDTRVGHSPSKISDLRRKYLKELRELQQLFEDNILTAELILQLSMKNSCLLTTLLYNTMLSVLLIKPLHLLYTCLFVAQQVQASHTSLVIPWAMLVF